MIIQRMQDISSALRTPVLVVALLALAGCSGNRGLGLAESTGPSSPGVAAQPSAPPVHMAGRWLFESPGYGQCSMTFGAASPTAPEGTIAPAGGCPGQFFTSRKWTYDQTGLTMRDHNGEPLAQLAAAGGRFQGRAVAGQPVTLTR